MVPPQTVRNFLRKQSTVIFINDATHFFLFTETEIKDLSMKTETENSLCNNQLIIFFIMNTQVKTQLYIIFKI